MNNNEKVITIREPAVSVEGLLSLATIPVVVTAIDFVKAFTERVKKVKDSTKDGSYINSHGSLINFTKVLRVEPITIIDQRIGHLPYLKNILQMLNSVFAAYYLQAVALSVNVGKIEVIKLLSSLNPDESVFIPSFGLDKTFSGEGLGFEDTKEKKSLNTNPSSGISRDSVKEFTSKINDSIDLSVGKIIEVTIEDSGAKATFPISIRLLSNILSSSNIVHILKDGSKNRSFSERWHGWKSGALQLWRDLILCQDLIDEHKKALIQDKSGIYQEINRRENVKKLNSLLLLKPSPSTASNLVVISKETIKELELEIGGRFSDFATREKVFNSTYLMIVVVIDPEYETVTIYHRSIALPTTLNAREIKSSSGKSDVNILEVLQAYQLGKTPVI